MVRAKRWASWHGDYPKRKTNGRWLCRWCDKPCPGRRENVCSEPCMREIAIRCWSRSLRYYTFERDDGICERCGLDTIWLRRELLRMRHADREAWLTQIMELGFTRKEGLKSFWQADHIEIVSVTGPVGLSGIQTLCVRCHKRKTVNDLMPAKKKSKQTTPRPTAFREKGLWFTALSIKVELLRKAHRTNCIACGKPPVERRLKVQRGAGRGSTSEVYCESCGEAFLARMNAESDRAANMLTHGKTLDEGAIRLADAQFERVKQTQKERAAERKRKREAERGG